MFGFLNPRAYDLSYRSLYARCCQHQHRHFGKLSLPSLSYESVFLYALALDAGAAGKYEPPRKSCCRLMVGGTGKDAPDAAIGKFVAAVGILLAGIKLDDNIRDGQSRIVGWANRFRRWLLCSKVAAARDHLRSIDSHFDARLEGFLATHAAMEASDGTFSVDEFSQPTAEAFGYVFGLMERLPGFPRDAMPLAGLGRHIGVAMLSFDCAQDWREDLPHGLPNPIRSEQVADDGRLLAAQNIQHALALCQEWFGPQARTEQILAAVERHVLKRLSPNKKLCLTCQPKWEKLPAQPTPGVVMNATCCIPCGDGAIAVDSKEVDGCCNRLCGYVCLCICCGPVCCQCCLGGGK